jgi:hypothetical protein
VVETSNVRSSRCDHAKRIQPHNACVGREALKYADIELQRRCVISTKIREALSDADTFLAQVVAEQPPSNASRKSADYDEADTGRDKLDRPER